MENPFQVFSNEKFRTLRAAIINDAPWFVARDVAEALGYAKTEDAVKRHVSKGDKAAALVPLYPPNAVKRGMEAMNKSVRRRMTIINESGLYSLILSSKLPEAQAFKDWVTGEVLPSVRKTQAQTIGGVRCYLDPQNTAWINAEDVARGLGFVEAKKFSTSGENYVRWERVNEYLKEFGYGKEVSGDDFIPENIFYRLAMKANNETAKAFQAKVADEILPSIRKTGSYTLFTQPELPAPVEVSKPEPIEKKSCVYVLGMSNHTTKIGMTGDILERAQMIERQSGAQVERIYNSALLPKDVAATLEKSLHDQFNNQRLEGEFFNTPFEEACRFLVLAASELPSPAPALPALPLVDKLISIADKMEPSPERQQILIRAANLLDAHF